MHNNRCVIENCKTTIHNKGPHINLHPCPTNYEMRTKWMKILKNKCFVLEWTKSKICSKHFEAKYFDSQRKLKESAIPTLFGPYVKNDSPTKSKAVQNVSKVDKILTKMTQAELTADVKYSYTRLKEPSNLEAFINNDVNMKTIQCKPDAPMEAKLWLMVKKQDNLITRLMDLVVQTKKHLDILQNSVEETKTVRKEQDHDVESLKYIVKCLQEKHATLEEQIEILTAVESR